MQVVGDICGPVLLGNTGVGNPLDVTAIVSLIGTFTNAVVAIEAVPIGQLVPFVQGATGPPVPTPAPNQWIPILELGVIDGVPASSPVGPLTSAGTAGSGYAFTIGCGIFQQLRMRLVGIGGGAIQGGIATLPFPVPTGLTASSTSGLALELQRIRIGIGMLVDTDLKDVLPVLSSSN